MHPVGDQRLLLASISWRVAMSIVLPMTPLLNLLALRSAILKLLILPTLVSLVVIWCSMVSWGAVSSLILNGAVPASSLVIVVVVSALVLKSRS